MITDRRSPAPPACYQSLRKHHVVWYCLGIVVAGFRSMAWLRCNIAAGMLFSAFAVNRFVTIWRHTAQFCFGLLMDCLFWEFPPSLLRLLAVGLCMSPGEIIR